MLGIVLPTLMCFNLNTCCILELHLTEFVIFFENVIRDLLLNKTLSVAYNIFKNLSLKVAP
jgi:hypothetical protein